MPREVGDAGESRESRGADRLDDWQRIEPEQADRAAEQRRQDAIRDPSPEFERSARDLGPDYGCERPRHRKISSEVAAEFGKTPEQVHALRDRMFDEMAARREHWAESEQPVVTSAENAPVDGLASSTTRRGQSSTMSLETRMWAIMFPDDPIPGSPAVPFDALYTIHDIYFRDRDPDGNQVHPRHLIRMLRFPDEDQTPLLRAIKPELTRMLQGDFEGLNMKEFRTPTSSYYWHLREDDKDFARHLWRYLFPDQPLPEA